MWIKHRGVIDVFTFAREGSFNNERLHIDVGLLHRGELWRQHADLRRLQSALIDKAWNFNTAILWKVINESAIGNVAIDNTRCARFHGMNNERTIFLTAFVSFVKFSTLKRSFIGFPFCDLQFTACDVFVDGNLVLLKKIRLATFDEPRNILAEVFARLSDKITC